MFTRVLLLLAAVLLLGADLRAAEVAPDSTALLTRVQVLTAPELAGRGAGTPAALAAADSVAAWFAAAGAAPGFSGGWFQDFSLSGSDHDGRDLAGLPARNVAGRLPGRASLADRWIIVGAHHDHLGRVADAAAASVPAAGDYYPGANDNASGVTVLVELARLLAATEAGAPTVAESVDAGGRRSVLLVSFAAEEVGLQGSAYFVNHPPVPLEQVDLMVNFDTVGQLRDERLHVSGLGTAAELTALVTTANRGELDLSLAPGAWSGSDHMTFNSRGVAVLFLFSGGYPQYNRPTDTWQTLNLPGLVAVTAFSRDLLGAARSAPSGFVYQAVTVPQLNDLSEGDLNRDTWFGSIPDFTQEIAGYALAQVFDGSPAAQAGLAAGDVVVRLGGREVIDLASFTTALRSHDPGDVVEVEIIRDGRHLNFTVVLGDRSQR